MKRLALIAVLCLSCGLVFADTGNELLKIYDSCASDGSAEKHETNPNCLYTLGYVMGVADSQGLDSQRDKVCMPSGVTNSQLNKVVEKWMRDNPQVLHALAYHAVKYAAKDAWPCPEE